MILLSAYDELYPVWENNENNRGMRKKNIQTPVFSFSFSYSATGYIKKRAHHLPICFFDQGMRNEPRKGLYLFQASVYTFMLEKIQNFHCSQHIVLKFLFFQATYCFELSFIYNLFTMVIKSTEVSIVLHPALFIRFQLHYASCDYVCCSLRRFLMSFFIRRHTDQKALKTCHNL